MPERKFTRRVNKTRLQFDFSQKILLNQLLLFVSYLGKGTTTITGHILLRRFQAIRISGTLVLYCFNGMDH